MKHITQALRGLFEELIEGFEPDLDDYKPSVTCCPKCDMDPVDFGVDFHSVPNAMAPHVSALYCENCKTAPPYSDPKEKMRARFEEIIGKIEGCANEKI